MVRQIKEILHNLEVANTGADEELKQLILRNWAIEIIDECASNFECSFEQRDVERDDAAIILNSNDEVYPVLVRESIFQVTKQIK